MERKSFEELNLSNAFLFSAAMEDSETCQLALECILDRHVGNVKVRTEYNVLYNNEFKCIRLDVLGQDELEVTYDLEMQNKDEKNLPKRSRYYQAELDLAGLKPGEDYEDYEDLKPLYVIFICNFDPFGKNLCRYTFEMQCVEKSFPLDDGVKRIFLNIKGEDKEGISEALKEFLGYLNNSTDSYIEKVKDKKVKRIHEKVKELKRKRNLEAGYMYLEELLQDSYKDGQREGREKAFLDGIKVLIKILCNFLPDVESIYRNITANEIYKNVTREQIEACYNEIMAESKNNSKSK